MAAKSQGIREAAGCDGSGLADNGDITHDGDEHDPLLPSSHPSNKYELRSLWRSLVFGWFTPVLEHVQEQLDLGMTADLSDDKIPKMSAEDSTDYVTKHFEEVWNEELSNSENPSLAWCLWKAFSPLFLQAGILKAVHDCLQFVGPQVLNGLILFLGKPSENLAEGFRLVAAVTVAQLLMSLCLRHYFFMCYRVSLRIRTAVLLAIYKKALTIDSSYYQKHPIGQVTNLMSVDTKRLQDVVTYLHSIWYSLLQITLSIYFLWQQLGPSCLAAVVVVLLSIPITAVLAKWMGSLQKVLMERKDARVQSNQETIMSMKVVKLQAWEGPFHKKVSELRRLELRQLLVYLLGGACTWLTWSAVPILIALGTFGAYVTIAGQVLDAASALTALALFELLRFPLFMLPSVINLLIEANVSVKRIEDFLSAKDHSPPKVLGDGASATVRVTGGTFSYTDTSKPILKDPTDKEQLDEAERELLLMKAKLADAEDELARLEGRPVYRRYGTTVSDDDDAEKAEKLLSLRRVNFECKEGEFVAVVGGVGSGKSTLLKAILGEVQRVSGDVGVRGNISYFDQKPFIMNDTVKGNILFGKPDNNEALYKLALKTSCLEHDLKLLPKGDMCEIGERGITLSGGQKARIAMARAVYHDARISLLDDCLSAVDAHVGRDLFEQCIVGTLLNRDSDEPASQGRTVILVTNALQYLSHAKVDKLVVLKDGLVVESGSYDELTTKEDSHFKSTLQAFTDTMSGEDYEKSEESESSELILDEANGSAGEGVVGSPSKNLAKRHSSPRRSSAAKDPDKKEQSLMTDEMEESEIGQVSREVYKVWADAAGGLWVALVIFLVFAMGELIAFLSNWWLTYWSRAAEPNSQSQMHFLAVYGAISVASVVAQFLRMAIVIVFGLQASAKLFESLLDATLHVPMSFFDTTPAGRIMNRFSKDVYTLDEELPMNFRTCVDCFFRVISALVVVTSVTPAFAPILIPILYFYRQEQVYFSQSYRELKRIDAVARSPIYALFGETLDGPSTVRAFNAEKPLLQRMHRLVDHQQHAFYLTQAGLSWLAVRLELIGTVIITAACTAAVFEKQRFLDGDPVFAGLAGLSISYSLTVTQELNWAVRVSSDFEANMVSVERIRQYCMLNSEAPRQNDNDKALEKEWPTHGLIAFKGSQLRYRPGLPLVLKGLDLTIPPRSKVGIVGRTGAGKSTIMTAMMRLVELDGGSISIDGVDTRTLGLERLRSSIAVIPQDPVLFSGTVRTNLDPFNQHSETELMDVLERVGMWKADEVSAVRSVEDEVLQDGDNFSAGQRQLLVIARALLDGARIVICDEATAAIDAEADARIQRVLRTDFANATTLTIAHRLNTIMDSSHILVMDDGKCAEFDTPRNLLAKGGQFKDLVDRWEEEHRSQ